MLKFNSRVLSKMVAVGATMFAFNASASDWTYYPGVNILTDGTWGFTASVIDGTTNQLAVTDHISSYSNDTHSCALDLKNGTVSDASGNRYEIAAWAVKMTYKSHVTSVSLPSTIRTLTGCFSQCSYMTHFDFESEHVTSIPGSFLYSSAVTNGTLRLPNVTAIGSMAFQKVNKWNIPITNVLNRGVTSLGTYAFDNCAFSGDVVLTNYTADAIPLKCFNYSSISSIDLTATRLSTISDYAFYKTTKCKRIAIRSPSLSAIRQYAFSYSTATNDISDIALDKVTTVGQMAFDQCAFSGDLVLTNLLVSTLPQRLLYFSKFSSVYIRAPKCTTVAYMAFGGLRSCTNAVLDLPNCTTFSGGYTFELCGATNDVMDVLPRSVTSLADCTFDSSDFRGVADLSNIPVVGLATFRDAEIDGVVFGDGLKTFDLSRQQFSRCANLKTVTFGDVDIDAVVGTKKNAPDQSGTAFLGCDALERVTFKGAAPTNCVDETSGTNLVTNGRLFVDTVIYPGDFATNTADTTGYKDICIYANRTNGWSNYASPIDPAVDGPAPDDAYGVYVTAAGNRKAWLCEERTWTYDPTRLLLSDGRWGFSASVVSGTNLNVTGHHASYANTAQSGTLDLRDKPIAGTDGKNYSIQQWSVKFTQSHPVSKVHLPSTIKDVTGTFASCTNLQEIVFESDLVDNLPYGFMTSLSRLTNGVVRLPNLTNIRGNAFRNIKNWRQPIANVVNKGVTSIGDGAFRYTAMTGDVVVTNLQNTIVGAYTFNCAAGVTSVDITAPKLYNVSMRAFDNMESCTNISIRTGTRTMIGANCFKNDVAANDISDVLTPYVYFLGEYAFDNTKFTGDANLTPISTLSNGAFHNSSISSATFSANLTSFGCVETFANSQNLRELTFNDCDIDRATASKTIDLDGTTGPFYNCSNIVSVTFRGRSPTNSAVSVTNGRRFLDALVASGVSTTNQTATKKSIVFYAEANKGWRDFASPLAPEDGDAPDFCYGVYVTTAGERKAYMVRRPMQFHIIIR